jgi:hypothetical protein
MQAIALAVISQRVSEPFHNPLPTRPMPQEFRWGQVRVA